MMITSHIIIFKGYSIKKQEQIDVHTHRYLRNLAYAHQNIIREHNIKMDRPQIDDRRLNLDNEGLRPPPPPRPNITKEMLNKELVKFDMEVSNINLEELERSAELLSQDLNWKLYRYQGYNYIFVSIRKNKMLIKDNVQDKSAIVPIVLLTVLLNLVFITFYIFLIKKLIPLISLKKDIILFSKGNLNIDTSTKGKDEISEVANEFNNAITTIRNLTESRNLFLRNIMHEFKTPITRGFIIADMLEDTKYHKNLKKAFERLDYLLNELARLEMLTSNNLHLKKENFRIIDILDNSLDILLLDSSAVDIEINTTQTKLISVDFEFFTVAVKNLIDNAIKYGDGKPIILVEENSITIKNKGEELEKPLDEYFKAFNRNYESSSKGLGLGLYIVHSVLKAHGFKLTYEYKDGYNSFIVKL